MKKYVYGPVPSKRLGQSLGVDTIPSKTCNWNCVYCQLGRTPRLSEGRMRAEYFPQEDILEQVRSALAAHQPGEIDWVTFVGSGEPTLHSGIGWLIREIKKFSDLPIAVITNGSLLYLPEVCEELLAADAVMPSLDAGSEALYRRINRALPELTFEKLLSGLVAFRKEFSGKLWVETMLLKGVNDTEEALVDMAKALKQIQPDQVHINLPTRPPSETWVEPTDEEGLKRAARILGEFAHIVRPVQGKFDLGEGNNLSEAILGIISRHPLREDQLQEMLANWDKQEVEQVLTSLLESQQARVIERFGKKFWTAAGTQYMMPRCSSPDDQEEK